MSDGPHRSLKMRRGWKQLAKRADKKAFAPEEVRDAFPVALEQDWRAEVPKILFWKAREILRDGQGSFFGDQRIERLERIRMEAAGYPLANTFLDCAIQKAAQGCSGDRAVREAIGDALLDRALRGTRQVEEHYRRESLQERALHVRDRLEDGVKQSDIAEIARRLVKIDKSKQVIGSARQTGLDDGVKL